MNCAKCAYVLDALDDKCPRCGAPVRQASTAGATEAAPTADADFAPEPAAPAAPPPVALGKGTGTAAAPKSKESLVSDICRRMGVTEATARQVLESQRWNEDAAVQVIRQMRAGRARMVGLVLGLAVVVVLGLLGWKWVQSTRASERLLPADQGAGWERVTRLGGPDMRAEANIGDIAAPEGMDPLETFEVTAQEWKVVWAHEETTGGGTAMPNLDDPTSIGMGGPAFAICVSAPGGDLLPVASWQGEGEESFSTGPGSYKLMVAGFGHWEIEVWQKTGGGGAPSGSLSG